MKNKIIFGSPLSGVKICTLWKNIPYQGIHISGCKLSIYFAQKNYFFYFTHSFLQNTHISLSILHIYSIKYSFFYHLLLFSHSLPLSLSLLDPTTIIITTPIGEQTQPSSSSSLDHSTPNHHHHPPRSVNRPIQDPLKLSKPKTPLPHCFRAMETWVPTKLAVPVTRMVRSELEQRQAKQVTWCS